MLRKPSSAKSPTTSEPAWLRVFESTIDAVKALAWPALVVAVIVVFFAPIERMVNGVATKLELADKVSIGSLSLEIVQRAREAGSPELAAQVGSLSPQAIERLLLTPRTGDVILLSTTSNHPDQLGLPKKARLDALIELSQKGFIEFREDIQVFVRDLRKLSIDARMTQTSEHDWFIIPEGAGSTTFERYRRQGFKLTDKGRIASEAVIKAVTAQLSR